MVTADLSRKATLAGMRQLGALSATESERPGSEPTTPPGEFEGRSGYDSNFLPGWNIPLPLAFSPDQRADMRTLRRGGTGVDLTYEHFSVVMSRSRRLPMLTATNIDGNESRRMPRIDTWSFDGRLDKSDQWGDELYARNPLDRGHMVRREDPVWGPIAIAGRANRDTFHFTNSCPQMAGVNQRVWLGLENYILHNARADGMRVSVFTGPFFTDLDLEYRGALIPLSFWKVVAFLTEDGRPSATAYKVSQEQELAELEFVFGAYKTFQISIQEVIDGTGLDFRTLTAYDGFSEHELAGRGRLTERLDQIGQIRV